VIRRRTLWRRLLVAGLVILSLAVFTLFFREQAGGALHGAQKVGASIMQPLESGVAKVIKPFRDAWNWVGGLFSTRSENKRLRSELDALRKATTNQLEMQQENAQLRGLLKITKDPLYPSGVTFVPARVIARSTDVWYSTVTINAGSSQGVALYDAVVNPAGLVGRVTEVTSNGAEVTLITDQSSWVDAEVLPGGTQGPTQGSVHGSVTGDVSMEYVDKTAALKVGQIVATSGLNNSIFVRGIPIGVVENVGRQAVEIYQTVTVKPFVDVRQLDFVMVVHR
jgi:rod shape-determining protein MreC